MDYCGDTIGIRVSENQRFCQVILKRGTHWDTFGDAHPVGHLSAFDRQTGGSFSTLMLAWKALGDQNPKAQSDLQELISAAKESPAAGMAGELSRGYEAKKLELERALREYLEADRAALACSVFKRNLLESMFQAMTIGATPTVEDFALHVAEQIAEAQAWKEAMEKGARFDQIGRELSALRQKLNPQFERDQGE